MKKIIITTISFLLTNFTYAASIDTDVSLSPKLISKGVYFDRLIPYGDCVTSNVTSHSFHLNCPSSMNSKAEVRMVHPLSFSDKYDSLYFRNPAIGKGYVKYVPYGYIPDDVGNVCYLTSGFSCYAPVMDNYSDGLPFIDNFGQGSKLVVNHLTTYQPDDHLQNGDGRW